MNWRSSLMGEGAWPRSRLLIATVSALALLGAPALRAHAQVRSTTLVYPIVNIFPGDRIERGMVALREAKVVRDVSGTYATRFDQAVDRVAKRTLRASHAIPLSALRAAYAITDGDRVQIVFMSAGLTITAVGIALQPGEIGALISVRNADTGVVVRGRVGEDGRVVIGGT